jgi:hypothetical protein
VSGLPTIYFAPLGKKIAPIPMQLSGSITQMVNLMAEFIGNNSGVQVPAARPGHQEEL